MNKLLPTLLFLFLTMSAPSQAVPIVSTIEDPAGGGGGFWIGAFDIGPDHPHAGPDGLDRFVVAQSFRAYRDYSNVTAAVLMGTTGGVPLEPVTVNFELAADDNGQPGVALTSLSIAVTSISAQLYQLAFQSLRLLDDHTYWLVASSPLVQYGFGSENCCVGSLPVWRVADDLFAGPMGYSQNSAPWVLMPQSLQFAMDGTELGDPIANGNGPNGVPEPTTLALFGIGLVGTALTGRRRVRR